MLPPSSQDDTLNADVPRESITRLIVARPSELPTLHGASSVAHTRPTTPVPTDYLFLAHHRPEEPYAGILAGRLEELGDEAHDATDRGLGDDEGAWSLEEVTRTRMKTVVPDGSSPSSTPGPRDPADTSPRSAGMFSLLASVSLVPYLRQAPRDIPRGTIDHGQACVLALIDGRTSIEQLLETSPMPVSRVLRILSQLLESGVLGLAG